MSLIFEWDERKNQRNIAKHGIDFADVKQMFDLPLLVQLDQGKNHAQARWTATGWLRTCLCVVVFSEPGEDRIRVISIRKATKREAREYGQVIRY